MLSKSGCKQMDIKDIDKAGDITDASIYTVSKKEAGDVGLVAFMCDGTMCFDTDSGLVAKKSYVFFSQDANYYDFLVDWLIHGDANQLSVIKSVAYRGSELTIAHNLISTFVLEKSISSVDEMKDAFLSDEQRLKKNNLLFNAKSLQDVVSQARFLTKVLRNESNALVEDASLDVLVEDIGLDTLFKKKGCLSDFIPRVLRTAEGHSKANKDNAADCNVNESDVIAVFFKSAMPDFVSREKMRLLIDGFSISHLSVETYYRLSDEDVKNQRAELERKYSKHISKYQADEFLVDQNKVQASMGFLFIANSKEERRMLKSVLDNVFGSSNSVLAIAEGENLDIADYMISCGLRGRAYCQNATIIV